MPKQAAALSRIPPQTLRALETLGSHLAVARVRRKESLAKRIGVSIPTLTRLESGDPSVSMGIYATALIDAPDLLAQRQSFSAEAYAQSRKPRRKRSPGAKAFR